MFDAKLAQKLSHCEYFRIIYYESFSWGKVEKWSWLKSKYGADLLHLVLWVLTTHNRSHLSGNIFGLPEIVLICKTEFCHLFNLTCGRLVFHKPVRLCFLIFEQVEFGPFFTTRQRENKRNEIMLRECLSKKYFIFRYLETEVIRKSSWSSKKSARHPPPLKPSTLLSWLVTDYKTVFSSRTYVQNTF